MSAIPPLAGLCTYGDAASPGTTVDEAVAFLRRLARIEHQSFLVLCAHLNAVPEWEVKCAFALHIWQDAEHCGWLRTRVTEMRKPPHYLDRPDDAALEAFFEELLRSRSTRELLTGVYAILKPSLLEAIDEFRRRDNPLADYPTFRLLRFLELEEREQLEWGRHRSPRRGAMNAMRRESGGRAEPVETPRYATSSRATGRPPSSAERQAASVICSESRL